MKLLRSVAYQRDLAVSASIRKSILYAKNESGVGNAWSASLGGAPTRKLTHFISESIWSFDLFQDNRLDLSRGHFNSDGVLLENVQ